MAAKRTFFRYIDDEESLNDFFVSLLSWSLEEGPDALNAIHTEMQFAEGAEVIATQRDGLSQRHPENSQNRTLDWVVRDSHKIVGYESKTGNNSPSSKQLKEELRKLERNNNGLEVFLYTFTDHPNDPTATTDARWISWYEVAERIISLETENRPIEMMKEMFREEGYDKFTGFEEFKQNGEWLARHDEQIVELAFDVNRHLDDIELYTGGNLPQNTTKSLNRVREKSYVTLNQAYHVIPFHPKGYPVNDSYRMCLFVPAMRNEVYVYMDINVWKDRAERKKLLGLVQGNQQEVVSMVEENDMHLITSNNSLNHGDKELLEYNQDEVADILQNKAGESRWKRLFFGWEINAEQPNEIVSECADRLKELDNLFFEDSEYIPKDEIPVF